MEKKLTKIVLDKIKEIYPKTNEDDIIVLFGSRAKDCFLEDSDIDIVIYTKKYSYYQKTSVEKGCRKQGEDAGFEFRLENKLLLEVKIMPSKLPNKSDVMSYHDILSAKALTSKTKFVDFQQKAKNEFAKNYDTLLFRTYMCFFDESKNLEGMLKRSDELMKINISMKKGIIVQSFLRLILLIEKQPYCFDKYLSHEVSKLKCWNEVDKLVLSINNINSFDDYMKIKKNIAEFINSKMPNKPYVDAWWKFLKDYKKIK